jgi:hypothetical protein
VQKNWGLELLLMQNLRSKEEEEALLQIVWVLLI